MATNGLSRSIVLPRAVLFAVAALFVSLAHSWPLDLRPVAPAHLSGSSSQAILVNPGAVKETLHPPANFDAAPNSVGLLFTTSNEDDLTHVWLPLGRRVYTRDDPRLPLRPQSARITTLIRSSPELATPEHLAKIRCTIIPVVNKTTLVERRWDARFGRVRASREREQRKARDGVRFGRDDGLVRLAEAGSAFWLGGGEVEAYECA
ncbi:hypothetical protein B0A48_03085 [Cryoendolithus antarcticus]|uniref:Uncharacterized protein n=1 Tax=Cryoendolithus antarcticus TaxID=1507870 RepID=A0A1V8TM36_9PEZI|nr:hypothetical protein B0A48_03085 [Cryoendolithus antarcticus]